MVSSSGSAIVFGFQKQLLFKLRMRVSPTKWQSYVRAFAPRTGHRRLWARNRTSWCGRRKPWAEALLMPLVGDVPNVTWGSADGLEAYAFLERAFLGRKWQSKLENRIILDT